MTDEEDGIYLCYLCVKQRGYRLPVDGICGHMRKKCDACSTYDWCFLKEDLTPAWGTDGLRDSSEVTRLTRGKRGGGSA